MRCLLVALAQLGACYRGGGERTCEVRCTIDQATGERGPCPHGLACSAQGLCTAPDGTCPFAGVDAGIDAGDDAPDGPMLPVDVPDTNCYGAVFQVCLGHAPTGTVTITEGIDTATDPRCDRVQTLSTPPMTVCAIAGATVDVSGTVRATGPYPLVVVATAAITINGTVDVAHGGAGAGNVTCNPGILPTSAQPGVEGGGAGGSFGGIGGAGGTATSNGMGGEPAGPVAVPHYPRAGCDGQAGALTSGSSGTVPFGRGGGVFYAISQTAISITSAGMIDASGGGSQAMWACAGSSSRAGGGGGGSGGLIGLESPSIAILGTVMANGGGGATGTDPVGCGVAAGRDPSNYNEPALGGADATQIALDGGSGGYLDVDAQPGESSNSNQAGGGGGGGVGYVITHGTVSGTTVSPPPTAL